MMLALASLGYLRPKERFVSRLVAGVAAFQCEAIRLLEAFAILGGNGFS